MKMLKDIVDRLSGSAAKKPKQTFFLYCPRCDNELCSSKSFVSDTEEGVKYQCSACDLVSLWNFDLIPGAIRHLKR